MSVLIPQGYSPIAVRDDRGGNCVISFNPAKKSYFMVINGQGCGPLSLEDMKQMVENMKDVIELKGMYVYIQDYDADGTKLD
jgi:hypothetical protein